MLKPFDDEYFMRQALKEAQFAYDEDEVPVGAVIVSGGKIIGRGHNLTERLTDVTAHAEMQAITAAAGYLGGKYLKDCTMYVTLEPCTMCCGALYWSQIGKIVIGAPDLKRGFSVMGGQLHPKTKVEMGLLQETSAQLIRDFFKRKRI